jgi:hypothetical protein
MCDPDPVTNPSGCPPGGSLPVAERDDMATFLASVSYPPPRQRHLDDAISPAALQGFADFFTDQGGAVAGAGISTCADANSGCHALPLGTATNSPVVGGFDAPTMRGMTDRFLQFSNGFTSTQEIVQPLLAPAGTGAGPTGNPALPVLPGGDPMTLRETDVAADAHVWVDGRPDAGTVACVGGSYAPLCTSGVVRVDLAAIPPNGLHRLQLQNGRGLFSNEMPICVGNPAGCH